jgi:hypothetical protein
MTGHLLGRSQPEGHNGIVTEDRQGRRYRYLGTFDVRSAALQGDEGCLIRSPGDFERWAGSVSARDLAEPFTYVVDIGGMLRLAPGRGKHVACAGGGDVLGAGRVRFARDRGEWVVSEVSNQSTGYCPDIGSWSAVATALDRAGLTHPGKFTSAFIFRRCPGCQERNVVKEGDFVCATCGGDLPEEWNVDHFWDRSGS